MGKKGGEKVSIVLGLCARIDVGTPQKEERTMYEQQVFEVKIIDY